MKVRTSPYLVLFILIACDGMPAPPCPPEAPLVSDFALPNGRQCTLCSDETKTRGDDCLAKCRCEDDDCNERVCSYHCAASAGWSLIGQFNIMSLASLILLCTELSKSTCKENHEN